MHPAIVPVTLTALAGVSLTVQPGRDIVARYCRFTVAFFLAAPFWSWLIVAAIVTGGALGTIPLAVVCSVLALAYRWTLRPLIANARCEARTAVARRKVRTAKSPGTVLAAAAERGHLTGRQLPAQAIDLPYSSTGSYILVQENGATTLVPVQ